MADEPESPKRLRQNKNALKVTSEVVTNAKPRESQHKPPVVIKEFIESKKEVRKSEIKTPSNSNLINIPQPQPIVVQKVEPPKPEVQSKEKEDRRNSVKFDLNPKFQKTHEPVITNPKKESRKNIKAIFTTEELTEVNKLITVKENEEVKNAFTKLHVCAKEEESPLIKKIKHEVLKHKESNMNHFALLIQHLKENYNYLKYHFLELFIFFFDYTDSNEITRDNFVDANISLMESIRKTRVDLRKDIQTTERKIIKDIFKFLDESNRKKINLEILNDFLKEICKESLDLNIENMYRFIDKEEKGLISAEDLESYLAPFLDFIESVSSQDEEIEVISEEEVGYIIKSLFVKKVISRKDFIEKLGKNKGISAIRRILVSTEDVVRKLINEMIEAGLGEDQSILKENKTIRVPYMEEDEDDEYDNNELMFFNKPEEKSIVNESALNESNLNQTEGAFTGGFGINLQPTNISDSVEEEIEDDEEQEEDDTGKDSEDSDHSVNKSYKEDADEHPVINLFNQTQKSKDLEEEEERGYSSEHDEQDDEREKTLKAVSREQYKNIMTKIARKESEINLNKTMTSGESSSSAHTQKNIKLNTGLYEVINNNSLEDSINDNELKKQNEQAMKLSRNQELAPISIVEASFSKPPPDSIDFNKPETPVSNRNKIESDYNSSKILHEVDSKMKDKAENQRVLHDLASSNVLNQTFNPIENKKNVNPNFTFKPTLSSTLLGKDNSTLTPTQSATFVMPSMKDKYYQTEKQVQPFILINNNNFNWIYESISQDDLEFVNCIDYSEFCQARLDTCLYSVDFYDLVNEINLLLLNKGLKKLSLEASQRFLNEVIVKYTGEINLSIKQHSVAKLCHTIHSAFSKNYNWQTEIGEISVFLLTGILFYTSQGKLLDKLVSVSYLRGVNKKSNLTQLLTGLFMICNCQDVILRKGSLTTNMIEALLNLFDCQTDFTYKANEDGYALKLVSWVFSMLEPDTNNIVSSSDDYFRRRSVDLTLSNTVNKNNSLIYSSESPFVQSSFKDENAKKINKSKDRPISPDVFSNAFESAMSTIEARISERKENLYYFQKISIRDFTELLIDASLLGSLNKTQLFDCFSKVFKKLKKEHNIDIDTKLVSGVINII